MNAQLNSLLLAAQIMNVIIPMICAVVGITLGFIIGKIFFEKIRSAKVGSVESIITKMKEDAEQECKALKKEAALEAKEQEIKLRHDFERESKEKRAELQKMEQRLDQRDELLTKKESNNLKKTEELEQQKKDLDKKVANLALKQEKIDKEYESVLAKLEEISGLT